MGASRLVRGLLIIFLMITLFSSGLRISNASEKSSMQTKAKVEKTYLLFFFSPRCPHCRRAHPFIEDLAKRYKGKADIIFINVLENTEPFLKVVQYYGSRPAVPFIVIGDKAPIIGYRDAETTGAEIEETLKNCISDPQCVLPSEVKEILQNYGILRGKSQVKKKS